MIELPMRKAKVAILSDRDGDLLWTSGWYDTGNGYCIRSRKLPGRRVSTYLHRLIMERMLGRPLVPGEIVDHINHDRLDCRRENLRLANHSQSMYNRTYRGMSGYRGVSFLTDHGRRKRYAAKIRADGHYHRLGNFLTAEEAARAYDAAARELHGEFATLNFPDA